MGRTRRSRRWDYQGSRGPPRPPAAKVPTAISESDEQNTTGNNDSQEIPGFYFDPDNKTYYRITPENSNFFTKKKQELKMLSKTSTKDCKAGFNSRSSTFSSMSLTFGLYQREYNCRATSEAFHNYVRRTKLKTLKVANCTNLDNTHGDIQSCQIMIGQPSQASVTGAWRTSNGTIIYNHCMKNTRPIISPIVNIHNMHKVIDMCYANIEDLPCILYVCNPIRPSPIPALNRSTFHVAPINQLCDTTSPTYLMTRDRLSFNLERKNTIWSCAWSPSKSQLAFGSQDYIQIQSIHEFDLWPERCKYITDNATALEFAESGVLYYGTNKGHLKFIDTRCHKNQFQDVVKLCPGLSYLKLLKSDHQILASCYDNKLVQIDLRTRKVVVSYDGHDNAHLKIPFTFCERANILCSVGQDNVTRFWNLANGTSIATLPPPNVTYLSRPWVWYSDDWLFSEDPESALVMNNGEDIVTYKPWESTSGCKT